MMGTAFWRAWRRRGWTGWHLFGGVALVALAVYATFDAWADIVLIAVRDSEASQVWLTPIVCGWLFRVRQGRLRLIRPHASLVGPMFVAAAWLLWSVGDDRSIQPIWHAGAVLAVVGAVITVTGPDPLRRFLPAFAVLVFLIPVPSGLRQQVAAPLQEVNAQVTQNLVEMLGVPVSRSGNALTVNGVPITIADECNGLRMVFALVLVSVAFAFGSPLRNYVRVIIVVLSPLTALAANVVRMLPTALVFGYGDESVAEVFHLVAGWAMLVVALVVLIGLVRLMRWTLLPVTPFPLAYEYR